MKMISIKKYKHLDQQQLHFLRNINDTWKNKQVKPNNNFLIEYHYSELAKNLAAHFQKKNFGKARQKNLSSWTYVDTRATFFFFENPPPQTIFEFQIFDRNMIIFDDTSMIFGFQKQKLTIIDTWPIHDTHFFITPPPLTPPLAPPRFYSPNNH